MAVFVTVCVVFRHMHQMFPTQKYWEARQDVTSPESETKKMIKY